MGENEHLKKKLEQSFGQAQQPQNAPTPGKQTLAQNQAGSNGPYLSQPSVFQTGHPLVDEGLGCDQASGQTDDCLLTPDQRSMLLTIYEGRLAGAEAAYLAALGQLSVETLIKKEPENEDLFMEIFLDVVGELGGKVAMKVFKHLAKDGAAIAKVAVASTKVKDALEHEGPESVKMAIGSAVSLGKSATKKALKKEEAQPQEKKANLAFLDMLKDRASIIFQNLREQTPVGLSDSLFLVLVESYDAKNGHTFSEYKSELGEKLDRFEKSGVGKVGQVENTKLSQGFDGGAFKWDGEETRAYWIETPVGRRLGLYKREFRAPHQIMGDHGMRDQTGVERVTEMRKDFERSPYRFVSFVPAEFVPTAIQIHVTKWGGEPVQRNDVGIDEIAQMGSNP